jgi:hypothetical protein
MLDIVVQPSSVRERQESGLLVNRYSDSSAAFPPALFGFSSCLGKEGDSRDGKFLATPRTSGQREAMRTIFFTYTGHSAKHCISSGWTYNDPT